MPKIRPLTSYIHYVVKKIDLFILKANGLQLGKNVFIGEHVVIDTAHPELISIGNNCMITAGTIILSHDSSLFPNCGKSVMGHVVIGDNTFIGVNSVIMPGVTIGHNVIIGANSLVNHSIPDNSVAYGNPAKVVSNIEELKNKVPGIVWDRRR